MKNYRLTQRGKIVFIGLFIALIIALVSMVTHFNTKIDPVSKELMINTDEIEKSEETLDNADETDEKPAETLENSDENLAIEEKEVKEDIPENIEIVDKKLMELYTLYYTPDDYKIKNEKSEILDAYYQLAITNNSDIIIEGNYHIDKNYNEIMFDHLSYQRAIHAKEYLIDKGIDKNRFTIIDNKSFKALNKDNSDSEVALNRRVDIYFKDFYIEDVK